MAQEPEAEQILDDAIDLDEMSTDTTAQATESEAEVQTAVDDQPSENADEAEAEEQVDASAALQAQINTLEDRLLRSQAEIQNIQQRNAREKAALLQYDGQKLATAILPAIDNLERALAVEANDEVAQQIKTGVELTLKTLQGALAEHGIQAVGEVGEAFDPNQHQAIQTVPADDDHAADTIANVLQKGYVLHDRVLRPAMVAVAQ